MIYRERPKSVIYRERETKICDLQRESQNKLCDLHRETQICDLQRERPISVIYREPDQNLWAIERETKICDLQWARPNSVIYRERPKSVVYREPDQTLCRLLYQIILTREEIIFTEDSHHSQNRPQISVQLPWHVFVNEIPFLKRTYSASPLTHSNSDLQNK